MHAGLPLAPARASVLANGVSYRTDGDNYGSSRQISTGCSVNGREMGCQFLPISKSNGAGSSALMTIFNAPPIQPAIFRVGLSNPSLTVPGFCATINASAEVDIFFGNTDSRGFARQNPTGGTYQPSVAGQRLFAGRVVSGVGGQYNFVAQAHALPDARSILMLRAAREKDGKHTSNIVWSYGHITIPRHLRDVVITEYGVARLLDKNHRQRAEELIRIAHPDFRDELHKQAQEFWGHP